MAELNFPGRTRSGSQGFEYFLPGDIFSCEVLRLPLGLVRQVEKTALELGRLSTIVAGCDDTVRSAVENVVRNAVKYTVRHAVVDVALRTAGRFAELVVSDQGPGVPAGDLERIFEPFYRVDGARRSSTGGTGLGLAIARRAVHAHGGTIHAGNNPDGGLAITMRLPLVPAGG